MKIGRRYASLRVNVCSKRLPATFLISNETLIGNGISHFRSLRIRRFKLNVRNGIRSEIN